MNKLMTKLTALGIALGVPLVALAAPPPEPADARRAAQRTQRECYDFASLPSNSEYELGDTVNAEHSTINIRRYRVNGQPSQQPENGSVRVHNGVIAGGTVPELRTYLLNTQVVPDSPVRKVSMRFGRTGTHSNIGVNGELVELDGSLADLNGRVLGESGKAVVVVNLDAPSGSSGPERGSLEIFALESGGIEKFAFGGVPMNADDVCIIR